MKESIIKYLTKPVIIGAFLGLTLSPLITSCVESRPTKKTMNLVVNTSTAYRTVTEKNELEGIIDIRELFNKTLQEEEEWLYLPDKEKWLEIGKGEYIEKNKDGQITSMGVKSDQRFLKSLMKENNNLVVSHYHPDFVSHNLKEVMRIIEQKGKKPLLEQDVLLYKIKGGIWSSIPSSSDINHMIQTSAKFYILNPFGEIKFKLFSKYGVAEYFLNEKGKQKYTDIGDTEGLIYYFQPAAITSILSNRSIDEIIVEETLKFYAGCCSFKEIEMNFTPYKELFKY